MRFLTIMLFLCGISLTGANAASFDCAKAKSKFEKFICSNQSLDEADKKMGEVYIEARKNNVLKGYIAADQKYWLKDEYTSCASDQLKDKSNEQMVRKCLAILTKRISDLSLMKKSDVYTNYEGAYQDGEDAGTLQILDSNGKFILKYQGNTNRSTNHTSYCWGEINLDKKGNKFYEEGESEPLITKTNEGLDLLNRISYCNGPTGEMPAGKFKLRK